MQSPPPPPPLALSLDLDDTLWPIWPSIERAEKALDEFLKANCPATAQKYPIHRMRRLREEIAAEHPQFAHDFTHQRRLSLQRALQTAGDDEAHADAAFEAFYASLPPIAASVHLAGGFVAKPIAETSKADLEKQVGLNLITTFLCCREAVKALRRSGGGRIVNVAARVVEQPPGGMTAYVATKAAVAGLTRSLAAEVLKERILVNAVLQPLP